MVLPSAIGTLSFKLRYIMLAFLSVGYLGRSASAQVTCGCGPDYCLNEVRYRRALDAKKKILAKAGYPGRLIELLDRNGKCYAAVTRSPDGFSIKLVYPNSRLTKQWSQTEEEIAKEELLSGKLTAYYIFNVNRIFVCCDEAGYDERSDWDAALDLNKGLAISCAAVARSVSCS